jgi:hypothetical protein
MLGGISCISLSIDNQYCFSASDTEEAQFDEKVKTVFNHQPIHSKLAICLPLDVLNIFERVLHFANQSL